MSAWGTTNHNKYAAPPRPPTRSMSGDTFSTTPRRPLVSFARSASLAATVSTPARGLPTPPPVPPLPKEMRHRSPSLSRSQQNFSPFAYSPVQPTQQSINTTNDVPRPYTSTSDFPQLHSFLPPGTPTRRKLFNFGSAGSKKLGTHSPPPPAVPPRPITSHGAQSYSSTSSISPAREKLPPVPARPNVLDISSASNSSESPPWSVVSPHMASCNPPLPPTSPIILASPRTNTNRYGFLNYPSTNRPHTAAPLQSQLQWSYESLDSAELPKPPGPPLPPLPTSIPAPIDPPPLPPPPQMDPHLEHALHLSRTESNHKSRVQQREDEELAKAIAESLALSKQSSPQDAAISINVVNSSNDPSGVELNYSHIASSSTPGNLKIPTTGDRSYLDLASPSFEKEAQTPSSLFLDMDDPINKSPEDELAMQLQQEETRQMAVDILNREETVRRDARMSRQLQEKEESLSELEKRAAEQKATIDRSINKLREAQEKRDAELARMMDEWEQGGVPSSESIGPHSPVTPPPPQSPFRFTTQPLPLQNAQAGPAGVMLNDETRLSLPPKALFTTPSPPSLPPGSGLDANSNRSTSATSPTSTSQPSDSSSVSRSHSGSSTIGKDSTSSQSHTTSLHQPSRGWSREPSPGPTSVSANSGNHVLPDSHILNTNGNGEEAEEEIANLRGFAYGFSQPIIPVSPPQASLACAPFPSIINLSPTPYPSFHIMAPSWRHLLRLLAGQETRIQAHIDVLATRKEEQKLRVVIQFVKLAYTGNTWRTIIHLSLDEAFPPTVPLSATTRFTNGDTTVLPYSYAISDHGRYMMGPNMQIYAVPLSSTSPFPILPITFPNLALYLQSVMKDSRARKVRHDSFRRLAKIVQSCYPEEVMPQIQEERKPSRGVGNLFKRVVGRVNNNNRGDGTGNEDVFDMITPFRLDQYTTPTPSPASTSASTSTSTTLNSHSS